jgi:hypothetical protein
MFAVPRRSQFGCLFGSYVDLDPPKKQTMTYAMVAQKSTRSGLLNSGVCKKHLHDIAYVCPAILAKTTATSIKSGL